MRLTNKGTLDKRYKKLEEIERSFWQKYGAWIGAWIVLVLAFLILIKTVSDANKPLVSPKGSSEARGVQEVKAAEPEPTPTPNPNRRYLKYKHMPRYEEIMGQLKYLYKNWEDAADLQSYENGFNPMAINPTSGACGLTQALPCSKLTCELGDVACDLNWQYKYIAGRYGTVTKALEFHRINGWY